MNTKGNPVIGSFSDGFASCPGAPKRDKKSKLGEIVTGYCSKCGAEFTWKRRTSMQARNYCRDCGKSVFNH